MITKALLASYLFSFISFVCLCVAIYGLFLNYKKPINRVFFLLSFSMSIWAFCYSVATSAHHSETAMLLNRISVLGWGTFYSFLLHLTKLLASGNKKISKKYLAFMYLPVAFMLLVFGLFDIARNQFEIVQSTWGFTSVTPATFYNFIFNIYSLFFGMLAIYNVMTWQKKIERKNRLKLVKITTILFFIAFVLSFLTDVVMIRLLSYEIIQMTIIWIFIPILFLFYTILKHKTMHSEISGDFKPITDRVSQERIFHIMGYMYILVAYAIFTVDYLKTLVHSRVEIILIICSIFMGLSHFFIRKVFKTENAQNLFLTLLYLISMTFLSYMYYDYLSITIWVLFFCYIVLTSLFNNMIYSYIMIFFMMLSTAVYWYLTPCGYVYLNWVDYLGRLFIILLFSMLIIYVNKAYKENQRINLLQAKKQAVINNISRKILELNLDNMQEKTLEILNMLNKGFGFMRTYYIILDEAGNFNYAYYIDVDDQYMTKSLANTIFEINSKWLEELYLKKELIIWNIENINSYSPQIKQAFEKRGFDGFCATLIDVETVNRSILVSEFVYEKNKGLINLYKEMLANLIKDAINKIDAEKKLFKKANYDDITGLIKRSFFRERVTAILENNQDQSYYVMYFDIDNFKSVNDTFGHIVGDQVLVHVANLLVEFGEEENLVTRISSDEFVVFCSKSYSKADIEVYAEKIVRELKKGLKINESNLRLSMSIGISHYPEDGDNVHLLVKNADIAMHKMKKVPYEKYHFCDEADKKQVTEDSMYTDKLFHALENNELYLVYQPQISLAENKVIGAEALLRWDSSSFGFVPPNKFIHILERTGLIIEVGEWIIKEVMGEIIKVKKMGIDAVRISINLSVVQFLDTAFISKLKAILNEYSVEPSLIEFEITESIAINDNDFVIDSFTKLKEMGFSIAIDDFGTGYSSLNRLQQLPIDRLKIDKSFVDGIGEADKREKIVNIVIEFAKLLGLTSIAEGAEEKYQVDFLKANDCDEVQGYYFAKPMPAYEFEEFIKSYNS